MEKFSKEFLFSESVLNRHCLMLRLREPIQWDDVSVDEIYMVGMCLENHVIEQLGFNFANSIDTYGTIEVKAFANQESPYDAKNIRVSTDDIIEVAFKNLH